MSDEPTPDAPNVENVPAEGRTRPSSDRPPSRDSGGYGGPPSDDDGGFRGRGGDGPRGRRDDRPRGPQTVKARLRAKARKKARKGKKKMFQRRKVCRFCADKKLAIDYKEPKTLRLFLSETGKLIPRRISGNCAKHQRPLTLAVKRARQVALLPYTSSQI
ncbi:MAG: 30S ribosomal protein S18 [Myxococcota bacterium]|nr:30S ribosomal protein S18 [Myxococcota bacterium]